MRGTILRDTSRGDGLLVTQGQQYRFSLEDHWRGDTAPRINQAVDVSLSADGRVDTVVPVDHGKVAAERGQLVLDQGRKAADQAANWTRTHGKEMSGQLVARIGLPTLAGVLVLLIATTMLTALSIRISGSFVANFSFYELFGLLNGQQLTPTGMHNGGAGIFAIVWLIAVLGPLVPSLSTHRWAPMGYFLPLLLWISAGGALAMVAYRLYQSAQQVSAFVGGNSTQTSGMLGRAALAVLDSSSLGLGIYLALLATAYFCYRGVRLTFGKRA